MAFKAIRSSDSTSAISNSDPAIDWDAIPEDDAKKYGEKSVKDPSCFRDLVKVKAGERLTVFEIGVIPPDEMVRIQDECKAWTEDVKSEELYWRCFLSGLRNIDGWPNKVERRFVGADEYVKPDWAKKEFVRGLRRIAIDIGSKIWAWNQLTEDEVKN